MAGRTLFHPVWMAGLLSAVAFPTYADDAAHPVLAGEPLEEIIVTGSRIQQRLEDSARPVAVLNRDDIDRAVQDSIGKVLQQLPGSTGSPANTNVNNGGDGSTRVNLRGLGPERSLVLLNGRRFVYGGLGGDASVDLNMIPSSLIERVEVLGVGSSTVYGADAVGGVVNIITRKDFTGAEVGGSYSLTGEQDGDIATVHFLAGQALQRGYFMFGGDAVNQAAVLQGAREYSSRPEYIRADGSIGTSGSTVPPQGRFRVPADNVLGLPPGNYIRVTGSGEPTTAEDFRPFINPDDRYNFAPFNYLQTPSERQSIWLQGGYDLTDSLSVFVEALQHHRASEQLLAASTYATQTDVGATPILADGSTGIPASNYYNPFGVDLRDVRRRFTELGGRRFTQDVDTRRLVAGVDGKFGADWQWEISVNYGRNDTDQTTSGELRADRLRLALGSSGPGASGNIVCGNRDPVTGLVPAQDVIAGCVPLNLFGGQGPDERGTITQDQLDYVTIALHDKGYNEQWIYDLVFHGDWGAIANRPVQWAIGATRREESAANEPDPAKLAGVAGGVVTNLAQGGQFDANEVFVESSVPLLHGLAAAEDLSLTAGVRFSDFSSFGSVTTYQGGLLYRPVRDITLRAGYGRVFRAPPVSTLFQSTAVTSDFPKDPCGNDPTPEQQANCAANGVPSGSYAQDPDTETRVLVGGNPDLQPEEGDSVSAGITLTPSNLQGFRLSVDYWRTSLDNAIILFLTSGDFLDACANSGAPDACGRISRHPDGSLQLVDARLINAASLEVEGYDFDMGYSTPLGSGQLDSRLMATYVARADLQNFQGADTVHAAGRIQFSAYPHWRGLGYVAYNLGHWLAAYQAQYIGSMTECGQGRQLPDPFAGCRQISDVWYQDVNIGYQFDAGTTIALAATNLADVQPPRVNTSGDANTDTATYRVLGRTYFLSMTYRLH